MAGSSVVGSRFRNPIIFFLDLSNIISNARKPSIRNFLK